MTTRPLAAHQKCGSDDRILSCQMRRAIRQQIESTRHRHDNTLHAKCEHCGSQVLATMLSNQDNDCRLKTGIL